MKDFSQKTKVSHNVTKKFDIFKLVLVKSSVFMTRHDEHTLVTGCAFHFATMEVTQMEKEKKLTVKQLQAVELMISTAMTHAEIAKELKVSRETVSRWSRKPDFRQELERENRERFKTMAVEARRELDRLAFQSKNDQVRLAAVRDILDRAGYKPKDEIDIGGIDIRIDYGD